MDFQEKIMQIIFFNSVKYDEGMRWIRSLLFSFAGHVCMIESEYLRIKFIAQTKRKPMD